MMDCPGTVFCRDSSPAGVNPEACPHGACASGDAHNGMEAAAARGQAEGTTAVKLVVCLGNPGAQYAPSRHNAGWMVADRLLASGQLLPLPEGLRPIPNGKLWNLRLEGGRTVLVLKPTTYMNASGEAVGALLQELPLSPREILAVSDDLDRPNGTLRLRANGSAGGHRGLQSIIEALQSQDFPRLRLGIGRPGPEVDLSIVEYVLLPWVSAGDFDREAVVADAVAVLREALCGSFDKAQAMASRVGKKPADKVNANSGENNRVQV